ncbi:MAG: DUF4863 family protein, partial [Proteobacteria bacterium]|nr:DUF4863 family protein [Pseudomonadota bacterium]
MQGIASHARRRPKTLGNRLRSRRRSAGGRRKASTMSPHRPRLPSYPADRLRDLYGSLSALLGISVDVVQLEDIVGPHHAHPKGEICLTMPVSPAARFDGRGAGWCVYEPGSAHHPTVTGGAALVLYLLPDGEIEFTKSA